MKQHFYFFPVIFLFCFSSVSCSPFTDAEKQQRDMLIRLEKQMNQIFRDARANMEEADVELYVLSLRDSSFRARRDTFLTIKKAAQNFSGDIDRLVSSMKQSAENCRSTTADTMRMSALRNPFAVKEPAIPLFGTSPADSLSCGVMKIHSDLKAIAAAFGTSAYYIDFVSDMKNELDKPAMKWGHEAFDNQPLIADITFLKGFEASVYSSLSEALQRYSADMMRKAK